MQRCTSVTNVQSSSSFYGLQFSLSSPAPSPSLHLHSSRPSPLPLLSSIPPYFSAVCVFLCWGLKTVAILGGSCRLKENSCLSFSLSPQMPLVCLSTSGRLLPLPSTPPLFLIPPFNFLLTSCLSLCFFLTPSFSLSLCHAYWSHRDCWVIPLSGTAQLIGLNSFWQIVSLSSCSPCFLTTPLHISILFSLLLISSCPHSAGFSFLFCWRLATFFPSFLFISFFLRVFWRHRVMWCMTPTGTVGGHAWKHIPGFVPSCVIVKRPFRTVYSLSYLRYGECPLCAFLSAILHCTATVWGK